MFIQTFQLKAFSNSIETSTSTSKFCPPANAELVNPSRLPHHVFLTQNPSLWMQKRDEEIPSHILCLLFVKLSHFSCLFLRSITPDCICGCSSAHRTATFQLRHDTTLPSSSLRVVWTAKKAAKSDKISFFFDVAFLIAVAFFLMFTLNAFRTFYMLSIKSEAIFRLIESAHWLALTTSGILALCYLTESTRSVIGDCSHLLISLYSKNAESCASINHKLDVCMCLPCESC